MGLPRPLFPPGRAGHLDLNGDSVFCRSHPLSKLDLDIFAKDLSRRNSGYGQASAGNSPNAHKSLSHNSLTLSGVRQRNWTLFTVSHPFSNRTEVCLCCQS
jgi:hypothetical protein